MTNLKARAVRGTVSSLIAQSVNAALRMFAIIVFARLLQPEDFGLMAMVTSTFGFLSLFKDFGLSIATIQRSSISQEQLSALFWINILAGVLLAATTLVAAWPVSQFYAEPRLVPLIAVFALFFIVSAAGIQHGALMQRQMRFPLLAFIETASLSVGIVVGLTLAIWGAGYWALLGMSLVSTFTNVLMVWKVSGWRPGAPKRAGGIRGLLNTGGVVTATQIVMHLAQNGDKILLGRLFGALSLGLYSRAQALVSFPTEVMNSSISGVLLSTLSRVREDRERIRSYFLKAYRLFVAITTPIATILALFAPQIVNLLLGPKWIEAAPFLRWLAPTALVYGYWGPLWTLLVTVGLVGRSLRMALVLGPVMIVGYCSGMYFGGALGAAIGLSASLGLWCFPHLAWAVHLTPVSLGDIARAMALPFVACGVAASASVLVLGWIVAVDHPLISLSIGMMVFCVCYAFTLLVAFRQWALFKEALVSLADSRVSAKSDGG